MALCVFTAALVVVGALVYYRSPADAQGAARGAPPPIRRDTVAHLTTQPKAPAHSWRDDPIVSPWPQGVLSNPQAPPPLPASELAKVEGTASVALGEFTCTLDNRSEWVIFNLAILVVVKNANGGVAFTRLFSNPDDGLEVSVMPPRRGDGLERLYCNGPLGATLRQGQSWTWSLIGARGRVASREFLERQDEANGYTEHRDPETGRRIVYDFAIRQWVDLAE
ncbi:MAG TPA: hypothetical protein VG269_15930 [Tepidisphaeraceae bacterium]|jgi:hypothetical protein|nr:hypothetical protein [Tepidisphaeraceae bacterium]